ncbi:MAG: ABC transporter, partial [Flavobacteriales bacterium]
IILANLDGMMKGRTSIFVSHRVSALRKADIVMVLDQGQIVQTGTPEELRVADGYYREIFNKQMGQANLV